MPEQNYDFLGTSSFLVIFQSFIEIFLRSFFVFSAKVLARFLKCFLASVETYNVEKYKRNGKK